MDRREEASAEALRVFDGWTPPAEDSWQEAVSVIWEAARQEFADEIEAVCEAAEKPSVLKDLRRDHRDLIYAHRLRKAIKRPKRRQ